MIGFSYGVDFRRWCENVFLLIMTGYFMGLNALVLATLFG